MSAQQEPGRTASLVPPIPDSRLLRERFQQVLSADSLLESVPVSDNSKVTRREGQSLETAQASAAGFSASGASIFS